MNFKGLGFGGFVSKEEEKGQVLGGENFCETCAGMREVEKAVVGEIKSACNT